MFLGERIGLIEYAMINEEVIEEVQSLWPRKANFVWRSSKNYSARADELEPRISSFSANHDGTTLAQTSLYGDSLPAVVSEEQRKMNKTGDNIEQGWFFDGSPMMEGYVSSFQQEKPPEGSRETETIVSIETRPCLEEPQYVDVGGCPETFTYLEEPPYPKDPGRVETYRCSETPPFIPPPGYYNDLILHERHSKEPEYTSMPMGSEKAEYTSMPVGDGKAEYVCERQNNSYRFFRREDIKPPQRNEYVYEQQRNLQRDTIKSSPTHELESFQGIETKSLGLDEQGLFLGDAEPFLTYPSRYPDSGNTDYELFTGPLYPNFHHLAVQDHWKSPWIEAHDDEARNRYPSNNGFKSVV